MLINYRSIDGRYDAVKCDTENVGIEHFIARFNQGHSPIEIANDFGVKVSNLRALRQSTTWLRGVIDYQIAHGSNKSFSQLGYLG